MEQWHFTAQHNAQDSYQTRVILCKCEHRFRTVQSTRCYHIVQQKIYRKGKWIASISRCRHDHTLNKKTGTGVKCTWPGGATVTMSTCNLPACQHSSIKRLLVQTRKRLHFWTNMWVQTELTFAFRFRKPEVSELNPSLLNWLLPQARSLPLMQTKKVLSPPAQICFTCCFPGKSTWNTLYSVLNVINNLTFQTDISGISTFEECLPH